MFKSILLAGAALAVPNATPAAAQIVGEWQYQAIADSPASFRVTRDPANPRKMTAVGDLGGHLVVFEGTFVNLTWSGNWYWWGDGATPPSGIYGCRYPTFAASSHAPPRRTATYGAFEFRLNAAETAMTGWWATKCLRTPENARVPGKISFSATRMNTYTAAAPCGARMAQRTPVPTPRGSPGSPPRLLGEDPMDDSACATRARIKLSATGSAAVPDTVFSARYRLRPCLTSVARSVQIDFLNPEGKRPMRLRLEGLRIHQAVGTAPNQTILASPTGAVHQQGLRFIGEPHAGQVMGNIALPGRICAAPFWLAWLDFSDGTRSNEPIGIVGSVCGIELHRDMLPAPTPGSGSDGPRPAGKVRVKGS